MTSRVERLARWLTSHRRAVIVVMLLATAVVGAGAPLVEDDSDLQQFEGDSEAARASEFIQSNFTAEGQENETTIQVIRQGGPGENVFTREEMIRTLEIQKQVVEDETIGPTLVDDDPTSGVANILALAYLGELLGGGQEFEPDLANVTETRADTIALLLGFEGQQRETVSEFVLAVGETAGGSGEFPDPSELEQEQVEQLAAQLGFDSAEQQATIVELVDKLGGGTPSFALGNAEQLDPEGEAYLAEVLGVSQLPPDGCLAEFEQIGEENRQSVEPPQPSLDCQIWLFEEMDRDAFENAVSTILGPNGETDALALLPASYEPGSTEASAHSFFITQSTDGGSIQNPSGFSESVSQAQLELRELGESQDRDYIVFGLAILGDEIDQSLSDSVAIVGPIALLFVIFVLTVAYRDLLDILLGVAGIVAVLLWTFGFMGWSGIAFNQLMISVPVLLIGLSIDYAIHVFMRHREHRAEGDGVERAMRVAIAGVGVALVWVTATAAIGFLSNLVSPIGPIQDFGVASAFGIFAALLVFGALIPALKIELDAWLESRGWDRSKRAFGTGDSRLSSALRVGAVAARRAPFAVLVLTLVVSAAGAYGATQVDTSFQQEDFLAEDPPGWTEQLPGPLAPGEYQVTADLGFIQENFQQVGREGEILIRGNVTDEEVLLWLDSATTNASEQDDVFILPNDRPEVTSPLSEMRDTAQFAPATAFNRTFANATAAGTDGIPVGNISGLYDGLVTANPASAGFVYEEGGSYEAIRMQVGVDGEATQAGAAEDLETVAAHLEAVSGGELEAIATGDPVLNTEVEQDLFRTVIESLIVTLIAVFVFLAAAYRLTGNRASLGVVTLLPVLFSVTWILGTMWLIGMPFNALTGTIAALTIGLGIAYAIHISSRYELELRRQGDVWGALDTTVTGTGGALLGSAATTTGGFGTLALAILPALQQFGIITGLTIIYAFLASLLVLPSLLVLWTRYLGPSEHFSDADTGEQQPTSEPTTTDD